MDKFITDKESRKSNDLLENSKNTLKKLSDNVFNISGLGTDNVIHPFSASDIANSYKVAIAITSEVKVYDDRLKQINNDNNLTDGQKSKAIDELKIETDKLYKNSQPPDIYNDSGNFSSLLSPYFYETLSQLKKTFKIDESQPGVSGVDQSMHYNDCWFEAALASLAQSDKGQKLIANMISLNKDGSYTVIFPGLPDKPINVTLDQVKNDDLANSCKWANILEEAAIRAYHHDARNGSVIDKGLSILTGKKALIKTLNLKNNDGVITNDINLAVKNGYPIVASTPTDDYLDSAGLMPNHVYSIVGINPGKNEIILRNPLGLTYNDNLKVGQTRNGIANLGGGEVVMPISTFKELFMSYSYVSG